jgi:hypothetical protein
MLSLKLELHMNMIEPAGGGYTMALLKSPAKENCLLLS